MAHSILGEGEKESDRERKIEMEKQRQRREKGREEEKCVYTYIHTGIHTYQVVRHVVGKCEKSQETWILIQALPLS